MKYFKITANPVSLDYPDAELETLHRVLAIDNSRKLDRYLADLKEEYDKNRIILARLTATELEFRDKEGLCEILLSFDVEEV